MADIRCRISRTGTPEKVPRGTLGNLSGDPRDLDSTVLKKRAKCKIEPLSAVTLGNPDLSFSPRTRVFSGDSRRENLLEEPYAELRKKSGVK